MIRRHYIPIKHWVFGCLFLGSLIVCLAIDPLISQFGEIGAGAAAIAQSPNLGPVEAVRARVIPRSVAASQLVQQGVDFYQAGDYQAAIEQWRVALDSEQQLGNWPNTAIILENLARVYQQLGHTEGAIAYWEQGAVVYRRLGNSQQVGRMLVEQAQAYNQLGQPRQAIALLCGSTGADPCVEGSALQLAQANGDRLTETAAFGSLGDAYRLQNDDQKAIQALESGLAIARANEQPIHLATLLHGLGSAHANLALVSYRQANSAGQRGVQEEVVQRRQTGFDEDAKAREYFQESFELAANPLGQMRGLLGAISSGYRIGDDSSTAAQIEQAKALADLLPETQDTVYALIELVHALTPISLDRVGLTAFASEKPLSPSILGAECLSSASEAEARQLLQQAIGIAQRLGDDRSASFALGELGHLYECVGEFETALTLTQQAREAAEQDLRAKDSLYLWEWQAGRIYKVQGQEGKAIRAYEQAVVTLDAIRSDLLIADQDLQFDFRDTVNPVYRELVELRLMREKQIEQPLERKDNIEAALNTLDSLKLAELQNYFGNDCVLTAINEESVDVLSSEQATAVFNSVILPDRTAIIANLPDGRRQIAWIEVDQETLNQEINAYRRELERFFDIYRPQRSQQVYDWLIRPFVEALELAQVKTLVFVQDGILRSVPMAALHDGEQFLVEKYAIATTPSLTLTDSKPLDRQNLRALALGLTESVSMNGRSFPPLENVDVEINQIKAQLPGTKSLLNQEFTHNLLQQELTQNQYSVVHMATHGEFGTEPQDTFLVTGAGQKLTITDLDALLRRAAQDSPVELLALTACQTATGDDRSALGLAGVTVQAGVRSALASLWFIDDAATAQIIDQFYTALRDPTISKAEALQRAQLSIIDAGGAARHPAYWAPFMLIGNWL